MKQKNLKFSQEKGQISTQTSINIDSSTENKERLSLASLSDFEKIKKDFEIMSCALIENPVKLYFCPKCAMRVKDYTGKACMCTCGEALGEENIIEKWGEK